MTRKTVALLGAATLVLTMSGTALASSAPAPANAQAISPLPAVSNNGVISDSCSRVTVLNGSASLTWDDPGLHQPIRLANNNTCFDAQLVAGGTASILRINPGGANCMKIVYPDPNENQYAIDEPCSTTDPLEQFVFYHPSGGGNIVCLKQEGATLASCTIHGLAVSADLNTEIVGAKQQGPFIWNFS